MPIPRALALLLSLLVFAAAAPASTFAQVERVCPIGGEKFKTTEAMSGTQFGIYLDLKPFGAIAAPWPIAKCPGNGFIFIKKTFKPEELELLTPYVASAEYQALKDTETNYYLAAKLLGVLKSSPDAIASTLLKASWEAKEGEQYTRYASEALDAFKLKIQQSKEAEPALTDQLVAGELERRLEKFDEAKERFTALSSGALLKEERIRSIVELQLKLIADRDARPTKVPPASK